jgi:protein TonB
MSMGSIAHLSREERVGLGVAAAAHVALVLALLWQVSDEPKSMPIPERMTVSLATEVSLRSTAPDPVPEAAAAVAPQLATEPAPPPVPPQPRMETRPEPRPTQAPAEARPQPQPTRAPAPRPAAQPTQRAEARPAPAPTRPAGGTRLGSDFLQGAGATEADRGTPAVAFGPAELASLNQAIARQLRPHWSAPQGVDAERLITIVRFRLNEDGSLAGSPTCLRQSGETPSNSAQKGLHCERAIRAVRLAAPFNLPEQFYDKWKMIDSTFDRRL